ncbi:energy transducer TonB [Acinetobacter proteolyticus]|uniref:Ferric siderophore ABC transporter substrate-binding protein n=1 Tax=Acinetobacter proteolyticus TaxID=1776741 RepID=A0A2N0WF60_9GAMM|nr:energy transducer TonB [Acinetobacter proteolyticus]PKF33519.1 ferric siderophore ABC transporter substrate-binding protein [Acinetobacter proteolyticus]
MKSKFLNPLSDFSTKTPSIGVFAHSQRKSIIVTLVVVFHLIGVWSLSHFIEPYTLATSPKVDALKVHFVSLSASEHASPQATAKVEVAQTSTIPVLEKQTSTRAAPTNTENTEQKVISSQSAVHEVAKQQSSHKVASLAATSTAAIAAQVSETKVKQDTQADQSSQMLTENPLSSKQQIGQAQSQSGGVNTAATQQELARAPESQVDRDEPVQVSSVDVLSFGKLAYDDRELKQQNRVVELRLRINENGQPIEIQLKQSSGISSLDQRVLQAARQSKFKPYKVNGRAVTVIVDFPVQLKLSRSR